MTTAYTVGHHLLLRLFVDIGVGKSKPWPTLVQLYPNLQKKRYPDGQFVSSIMLGEDSWHHLCFSALCYLSLSDSKLNLLLKSSESLFLKGKIVMSFLQGQRTNRMKHTETQSFRVLFQYYSTIKSNS